MIRSDSAGERHIGEGDLVRFLDGETAAGDRSAIATHLLQCAECSATLDDVRTSRLHLAHLLAELPVPALDPARRKAAWQRVEKAAARRHTVSTPSRVPFLRAAAVAGVLVASAFTVSPVRAFVTGLVNTVFERIDAVASGPAPAPQPEVLSLVNATVGFVPEGDVFRLEVASAQPGGSLLLGVSGGRSVTARAVGGDEVVNLVILPSGMRIENAAGDSGDYAVNLPIHLREVRVRVGEQPEMVFTTDRLAGSWVSVIDLGAPGSSTGSGGR